MLQKCRNFRHRQKSFHTCLILFGLGVLFVLPQTAQAQNFRSPANYIPRDNHIIVPTQVEDGRIKNYLNQIHKKHEAEINHARNRIKLWAQQAEHVEVYGLEGTGVVSLPTDEQKQKFFERQYMRFIVKDIEKRANTNLQETTQAWYERWTASDELDVIAAAENVIALDNNKNSGHAQSLVKKELKVGKERIKFDVQPRVEMGMIKFEFTSRYVDARAWLGINGNQEVRLHKTYEKTRTRAEVNYLIEKKRVIASINQPLTDHLSLRLVHDKFDEVNESSIDAAYMENNFIQLRFGMGF